MIELAELENGLVWLATIANVAPLMGYLGTVLGMIDCFAMIELAGEVDAQLVAGYQDRAHYDCVGPGIAFPMNIAHNFFVTHVDQLVMDIDESVQRMIDVLNEMQSGTHWAAD